MIDRSHALPVTRQARELGISRGSVYYLPRPTSVADLAIMRRLDELHMDFPFAGSRMLRDLLAAEGVKVGRLHVSTLMKKMAIEAIYRRRTPRSRRRDTRPTPICSASCSDATQPCLGDGYHLHPDELATVHPTILDQIGAGDMPREQELRTIASASREDQAAVWKKFKRRLSQALDKTRFFARDAKFGEDERAAFGIVWQEDLFAEGDEDNRTSAWRRPP